MYPLNILPVVVVRGLKRQQSAASTNFVGCFLLVLFYFFFFLSLLLLSALNDLTGPSAGPVVQIIYSIPFLYVGVQDRALKLCPASTPN